MKKISFMLLSAVFFLMACEKNEESLKPLHSVDLSLGLNSQSGPGIGAGWNNDLINGLCGQKFDFYKPTSASPTPLIISFHGGGFQYNQSVPEPRKTMRFGNFNADRYNFPWITATQMDNQKVAYATVEYALASNGTSINVNNSLADCASYIQYFQTYASDFNIDPNKIVVMGFSAGASASLWLGLQNLYPGIKGIVCFDPQASLNMNKWGSTIFNTAALSPGWSYAQYLPVHTDLYANIYKGMNPDNYSNLHLLDLIDANDPEIYLVSYWINQVNSYIGQYPVYEDYLHHPRHHQRLYNRSANMGVSCRLMYSYFNAYVDPSQETIVQFVKRVCQ